MQQLVIDFEKERIVTEKEMKEVMRRRGRKRYYNYITTYTKNIDNLYKLIIQILRTQKDDLYYLEVENNISNIQIKLNEDDENYKFKVETEFFSLKEQ